MKQKSHKKKQKVSEEQLAAQYLKEIRFRPAIMGVNEADVWKCIQKVCELYECALTVERNRCERLERKLLEREQKENGHVSE